MESQPVSDIRFSFQTGFGGSIAAPGDAEDDLLRDGAIDCE